MGHSNVILIVQRRDASEDESSRTLGMACFFSSRRRHTRLTCDWSSDVLLFRSGLWQALQAHSRRTHEPIRHIVSAALSDYLQVSHSTLHQVSTSGALVEGIYDGAVGVGTLQIGRASCRERGEISVGAVSFKKKK